MKVLSKDTIIEAIWVIAIAAILSFIVNIFHPQGVKITFQRPSIRFAPDSVFAEDLPDVGISAELDELTPIFINTNQIVELISKDNAILIDVREKEKYIIEHIPKSLNFPFDSFPENEEKIASLPKNKWLICYCDGPPCDLSKLFAQELMFAGFNKIAIYYDGLKAWKLSGKITEKGGL